jgi:hypothetical protein
MTSAHIHAPVKINLIGFEPLNPSVRRKKVVLPIESKPKISKVISKPGKETIAGTIEPCDQIFSLPADSIERMSAAAKAIASIFTQPVNHVSLPPEDDLSGEIPINNRNDNDDSDEDDSGPKADPFEFENYEYVTSDDSHHHHHHHDD